MAKKKHIWHCADGFPAKVTTGAKRTKYIVDPRNGKIIAYYNFLPLLAGAAPLLARLAPSAVGAVSNFIGGDKTQNKEPVVVRQADTYTTEERVEDALR